MDKQNRLLVEISEITRKIQDNHPELCQFLGEMPETIASESNPEIDLAALQNYYESLQELLKKAEETH